MGLTLQLQVLCLAILLHITLQWQAQAQVLLGARIGASHSLGMGVPAWVLGISKCQAVKVGCLTVLVAMVVTIATEEDGVVLQVLVDILPIKVLPLTKVMEAITVERQLPDFFAD